MNPHIFKLIVACKTTVNDGLDISVDSTLLASGPHNNARKWHVSGSGPVAGNDWI
jgi:hypothetical protein